MTILLIEDEPRAARRMHKLVQGFIPHATVIGPAESIVAAVSLVEQYSTIDLVISDIQLSDGLSFAIFEQTKLTCPVIFTTAYDQYAIQAFKVNGIDYLLKPIDEEELKKALDKFERQSGQSAAAPNLQLLAAQLAQMTAKPVYKERFMIKVGNKIKSYATDDILAVYSKDKTTLVLTSEGRSYVLDQTVDELTRSLDPTAFFRVNRGYLVAHKAITEVSSHSNSRLRLVVKGIEEEPIIVARERVVDFKTWLGA